MDLPNTGKDAHANILVTRSLLFYGEGRGQDPLLHVVDKATGEEIAAIPIPAPTTTAPMTYMHDGVQYIVLPVGSGELPGSPVALFGYLSLNILITWFVFGAERKGVPAPKWIKFFIVLSIAGAPDHPAQLVALALPE